MLGSDIVEIVVAGSDVVEIVVAGSEVGSVSTVLFDESVAALTDPTVNDAAKKSSIKTVNPLNNCFPMHSPQFYPIEFIK